MTKKQKDGSKLPYRHGAGAMLINAKGQVFVALRNDTPQTAWQMPQGGINKGEEPRVAVMRELEEEIGTAKAEIVAEHPDWLSYDLPDDLVGKVWKGKYRGQKQKWFVLKFLGDDSDINVETEIPEFSEWKWIDLEDLPKFIVPFKRAMYQRLVTEFRETVQAVRTGGST